MAKGLSVEEMVRLDEESDLLFVAEMIQLKGAREGSHFQLAGLEVQLAETVPRKMGKVQEPIGKGWAPGEELEGAAGELLLHGIVSSV